MVELGTIALKPTRSLQQEIDLQAESTRTPQPVQLVRHGSPPVRAGLGAGLTAPQVRLRPVSLGEHVRKAWKSWHTEVNAAHQGRGFQIKS